MNRIYLDELLTLLGVSPSELRRMISDGKFPAEAGSDSSCRPYWDRAVVDRWRACGRPAAAWFKRHTRDEDPRDANDVLGLIHASEFLGIESLELERLVSEGKAPEGVEPERWTRSTLEAWRESTDIRALLAPTPEPAPKRTPAPQPPRTTVNAAEAAELVGEDILPFHNSEWFPPAVTNFTPGYHEPTWERRDVELWGACGRPHRLWFERGCPAVLNPDDTLGIREAAAFVGLSFDDMKERCDFSQAPEHNGEFEWPRYTLEQWRESKFLPAAEFAAWLAERCEVTA